MSCTSHHYRREVGRAEAVAALLRRIHGRLLIIGGYGGADTDPSWVYNLRANPRAQVELAEESFEVTARELLGARCEEIFPKVTVVAPQFAQFQANVSRSIPIFELQRV
jgi:deazaflavin-dependent oxidoreductase (nitroreductase family)